MAGSSGSSLKASSGKKVKGTLQVSASTGVSVPVPVSVPWDEALSRGANMPATATMIANVNFSSMPLDKAKMTKQYIDKFGGTSGKYDLITSVNPANEPVYLIVPKLSASASPAPQTKAQITATIEANRQKLIAINNQMSKFFAGAAKGTDFASLQKQQQALWDENDALQSQLKTATS
jgi:hypothetical protein